MLDACPCADDVCRHVQNFPGGGSISGRLHLRVRRFGGLDAVPRSRTDGRCGGSQRPIFRSSSNWNSEQYLPVCINRGDLPAHDGTAVQVVRDSSSRVTAPERATIWRATRTRRILGEKRARTSCTDRSGGRALTGASTRRERAQRAPAGISSHDGGGRSFPATRGEHTRPYRVLRLEASARGALSDRVPSCCCSGRPRATRDGRRPLAGPRQLGRRRRTRSVGGLAEQLLREVRKIPDLDRRRLDARNPGNPRMDDFTLQVEHDTAESVGEGSFESAEGPTLKRIALADLMGEMALPPGTWFWLLDADTRLGDKERHPWVFPTGFDPSGRLAFGARVTSVLHAALCRRPSSIDFLHHLQAPELQRQAVRPEQGRVDQADPSASREGWINRGRYICEEPSSRVLGQIQDFEMNECR